MGFNAKTRRASRQVYNIIKYTHNTRNMHVRKTHTEYSSAREKHDPLNVKYTNGRLTLDRCDEPQSINARFARYIMTMRRLRTSVRRNMYKLLNAAGRKSKNNNIHIACFILGLILIVFSTIFNDG